MAGSRVLNANAVIALFGGDSVLQKLTREWQVYLPSVSLGELYYGSYKSSQVASNLLRLQRFIADKTVLACDAGTAQSYGLIRQVLRAKGRPIPANDIWIAATAIQYQLILVTRDQHFNQVDGLQVEKW